MKAKYRIITLASTVSLTLSILAGCSGKQLNGPGQSGSQSTGESVTIGGTTSGISGASVSSDVSGETTSGADSAVKTTVSGEKTSSTTRGNSSTPAGKVDPEKYRGTTVRFATWKDPQANEDGPVVTAFEKKYGIKVQVDMVAQTNYIQTLTSMIAAKDAPDICFDNNEFPASFSVLQPLEVSQIDMSDPIWDASTFAASSLGGKPYLCNTVGNIWSETDMVFFNKKLLEDNNIRTPAEYYEAGVWTFDAMYTVMKQVSELGSQYKGGYMDPRILPAMFGTGFFKLSNGRMVSDIQNPMLTKVYQFAAKCNKEGLTTDRDAFMNGKTGLCVTNAFGLKKTGYWAEMNPDYIGFTYLPDFDANTKAKPASLFRGWGIIKGAKNPVAAGIFLRYYLDVNNYNTDEAFINKEASNFFFKLTSKNAAQKEYYLLRGPVKITGSTEAKFTDIVKADPAQVAQQIDSLKNVVANDVKTINSFLEKQEKLYK